MCTLQIYPVCNSDVSNAICRGLPAYKSSASRYHQRSQRLLKRSVDVVVSLAAIVLLFPVALCIAIVIKLASGGPVLFLQERVGYQGKLFKMLKFRTMAVNNDAALHREFVRSFIHRIDRQSGTPTKIISDPRTTAVGRLLRRTSLDEIPQFINVLKGEMSLVGPRPCVPYEFEWYQDWHRGRVHAMPGLTGLWQVSDRTQIEFNEMIVLDLHYLRQWSIWLDLKILCRTPYTVLTGKGAY